jgi:hypothetical protein
LGHNDSEWRVTKAVFDRATRDPLKKKVKKVNPQRKLVKRIDLTLQALCRFIVKERAGWKCELAGRDAVSCSSSRKEDMQWAHLITRGASKTLKYDTQNAACLCSGHHKFYTHRNDLWKDICDEMWPERWEHSNNLKWAKTPAEFSYTETLARVSLEASQLKKGV